MGWRIQIVVAVSAWIVAVKSVTFVYKLCHWIVRPSCLKGISCTLVQSQACLENPEHLDNCVSLDHVPFLSVSLNDFQLIRLLVADTW